MSEKKYHNPNRAFKIGQDVPNFSAISQEWDAIKENVMRATLYAKFSQNLKLGEMLKATGGHPIVQLKTDPHMGSWKRWKGAKLVGKMFRKSQALANAITRAINPLTILVLQAQLYSHVL